jgi:hypothetical protein
MAPGVVRPAAVAESVSRQLASIPTRPLLCVLAIMQWLAAIVVGFSVGRAGPLAVVIPQVVILVPLVLVVVYGTALQLGGRVFAVWAAAVWMVLPYAALAYATPSLRDDYEHRFLPHLLGLSDDPRFPAMVALSAAIFFVLRALETARLLDTAIAASSAAVGAAFAPRAALVALAPVVGLAVAGKRRLTLVAGVLLAVLLAIVGIVVAVGPLSPPFAHVDAHALGEALATLRENFWSGRVLEWVAIAGVVGAIRGNRACGLMVAVSLLAALFSVQAEAIPVERNLALLRALLPVWPGVALAVASIPLLLPRGHATRTAADELDAVGAALSARLKRPW